MATQRAMRRFPLNLNIGNDICHVVRIRGILESARATRFIQKILNPDERRHPKIQWALKNEAFTDSSKREFSSTAFDAAVKTPTLIQPEDLGPSRSGLHSYQLQIAATFMAGRFAAKEAVIKAHPHRALTWHDITITSQASAHPDRKGAPVAIIRGENEDQEALVSISHDGEYATAVCLGSWSP